MSSAPICPAVALAHCEPELLGNLTDAEQLLLPYCYDLWLRPEQRPPQHAWQYCGYIAGRGWGKSWAIACEITQRVMRGEAMSIGLMAPNEDRVRDVQLAFLQAVAPPWFKPAPFLGGLLWPNAAHAECFTPEAPGRPRGGNFDLSWLCEIVDWQASTRLEAFNNITTATRVGRAQVIWDTTSKGKNDVILHLQDLNREDPASYPIIRGSMFDNYMLSRSYLQRECRKYTGRAYDEEILGLVFAESAGASFKQLEIGAARVARTIGSPELRLVAIDPALSGRSDADETGMIVASRASRTALYLEQDLSGHYAPGEWGRMAVLQCLDNGAAGVVIERNHLGDNAAFVIQSAAQGLAAEREITLQVRTLTADEPFPRRTPGVIYVREVHAATGKTSRASGPAAEYAQGHVHHVGVLSQLELELTTYEPGTAKSPNRYDAAVYAVIELAGLAQDSPKNGKKAVTDAARVAAALRERLLARPRHRRL